MTGHQSALPTQQLNPADEIQMNTVIQRLEVLDSDRRGNNTPETSVGICQADRDVIGPLSVHVSPLWLRDEQAIFIVGAQILKKFALNDTERCNQIAAGRVDHHAPTIDDEHGFDLRQADDARLQEQMDRSAIQAEVAPEAIRQTLARPVHRQCHPIDSPRGLLGKDSIQTERLTFGMGQFTLAQVIKQDQSTNDDCRHHRYGERQDCPDGLVFQQLSGCLGNPDHLLTRHDPPASRIPRRLKRHYRRDRAGGAF